MIGALQAEWLTLWRRPLTRVVLALVLGLVLAQFGLLLVLLLLTERLGALTGQTILPPEQLAVIRRMATLPGGLGTALGQINGLGALGLMILAGATLGSEYSWGTLRLQLSRHPDRAHYLAAKLLALTLLTLVIILLALLIGGLASAGVGLLLGMPGHLSLTDGPRALLAALRSLLILLPYMALGVLGAILGRSALAGAGLALGYWLADTAFGALALFQVLGRWGHLLYNLLLGQNVNALTLANTRLFGLDTGVLVSQQTALLIEPPSVWRASLVILLYLLAFLLPAFVLFQRRDISGPA